MSSAGGQPPASPTWNQADVAQASPPQPGLAPLGGPSELGNGDLPSLSLPKAGGAIRGMGEKFTSNPATGTSAFTIPVAVSPARGVGTPELSLAYDSGNGNGPYGLGWSVALPSISRRTDKGLPRYEDSGPQADIFQLTGAEDLVPELVSDDGGQSWRPDVRRDGGFEVARYRPRTEGAFIRIERWRNAATGAMHWKTISRENVASTFGDGTHTQIADPRNPNRVYRWLLSETRDDRGNVISYEYKQESASGVDPNAAHERGRLGRGDAFANRYLKRIRYGNSTPGDPSQFSFEVVFDYGEHDPQTPTPQETVPWPVRMDPFSTYRPGFELRTYRLCRRILLFHSFPELAADPVLVRSTDLAFAENAHLTYLASVTSTGYIGAAGGYTRQSLPPVEFAYTERKLDAKVRPLSTSAGGPARLEGDLYRFVDLDGEGIAGILSEQAAGWFYRRNLGSAQVDIPRPIGPLPASPGLRAGDGELRDLAGEGQPDLVRMRSIPAGCYPRNADGGWQPFEPFRSLPRIRWDDPNLRFVDLEGDGLSDILIATDQGLTWYQSRGRDGYAGGTVVPQPRDEDTGPRLVFADGANSVYLADMSGDGLTDLVRIRNGEIAYWPNRGYGQFGAKIVMSHSPVFDRPDRFDQRRVRLADVDGTGTTDIVYLREDGPQVWFNQAANSWSLPQPVNDTPTIDNLDFVAVLDALGLGTACLVVGSPLEDGGHHVQFVDLMGGVKPHLLASINNNFGLETSIEYKSSSVDYLADEAAGQPWVTRLPFPVQVVASVQTDDLVADTTLVTTYHYRHGYYDGVEREFRGFGYVEQRDAELFSAYHGEPASGSADPRLHTPPAVTKTWFHTGFYQDRAAISAHFAAGYWPPDGGPLLADTAIPRGLSAPEEREACRALRGHVLREEIYAEDNLPGTSGRPYSVTEHNYQLRRLQPRQDAPHCVVAALPGETITLHTERQPNDPRVTHDLSLEIDDWGNVVKSASIGYPRQQAGDPDQRQLLIRYDEHQVANLVDDPSMHRIGVPVETRAYEIGGLAPGPATWFTPSGLTAGLAQTTEIPFEAQLAGTSPQRRLLERSRTSYYSDDLTHELPLGAVGVRALGYRTYRQAFTPGLITAAFEGRVVDAMLTSEGGYLSIDGAWWSPAGRHIPDPASFYQPIAYLDPFGQSWTIAYDPHRLVTTSITDPLSSLTQVKVNYRLLRPYWLTDPNGNDSGVRFDELGQVTATAVMGKPGQHEGDVLDQTTVEASPHDDPTTRLSYDLQAYTRHGKAVFVHTFAREHHGAANPRWQESYVYTDGSGREALRKVQAEPGLAPVRGPDGQLEHNPDGSLKLVDTTPQPRWVGTGRTIYDNKGHPVKKYEPYFAPDSGYDTEVELVQSGVTPIMHYDPLGRLIATDHPDGTLSRIDLNVWEQAAWDRNDTVLQSTWYATRIKLPATDPEGRAARLAAAHANTPTRTRVDPLGRPYLSIADNGGGTFFQTHTVLEIQGNGRAITDARGNQVLQQTHDMLRRPLHTQSSDAGPRWILPDADGQNIRSWDGRGYAARKRYDELRRLSHYYATAPSGAEQLLERHLYGEAAANPAIDNLRTRVCCVYDGAGSVATGQYDFKGNVAQTIRQLTRDYRAAPNWAALAAITDPAQAAAAAQPLLSSETFTTQTTYDALNRITLQVTPDASHTRPTYNEANLLKSSDVQIRGAARWTAFVAGVHYNARGQRLQIEYGNGSTTAYVYDDMTFRLERLRTHGPGTSIVQELSYTYDPVGNVVAQDDHAQQTIFFANAVVAPLRQFTYDPTYRLTKATGREHIGQTAVSQPGPSDPLRYLIPHVNDAQAMRRYTEAYGHDAVGNLRALAHTAGAGSWTRRYQTDARTNRLLATSEPTDPSSGPFSDRYGYDAQGNITSMPHLSLIAWDVAARLVNANLRGGGTAYYQYDSAGQRVRAVVDRTGGTRDHRLYLGNFELYRHFVANVLKDERQTLHIMDDRKRVCLVETTTKAAGVVVPSPTSNQRFHLSDHPQSSTIELNESATVVSYEEYHPLGTTSYHAANGIARVSLKRYRFTGKEKDQETGFFYFGLRYYASWLGRWISPDPAGLTDGTNVYQYVRNNPIKRIDKTGTQSASPQDASGEQGQAQAQRWLEDFRRRNPWWQPSKKTGWEGILRSTNTTGNLIDATYRKIDWGTIGFWRDWANVSANVSLSAATGSTIGGIVGPILSRLPVPVRALLFLGGSSEAGADVTTGVVGKGLKAPERAERILTGLLTLGEIASGLSELPTSEATPGPRLTPTQATGRDTQTLVGSSTSQMRRDATKAIAADPGHPLKFLLDAAGRLKSTRGLTHADLADRPDLVQMGHITSKKSGQPERIMLQGAWENQYNNITVEHPGKGGAFIESSAVDIGGIAVDPRTAQFWESIGWLPAGTVAGAPVVR